MKSPQERALLLVISAPSGGGKTTVCQQMLAAAPSFARAITCTTRSPRAGEQDGVDYYFLDALTFQQKVEAGEFLEHANVFGNHYGTLKREVLDKLQQGKDVLLAIDVQGAASIRGVASSEPVLEQALVTVFLAPPSLAILEQRLRKRGLDAQEVIEKRLRMAAVEIAQAPTYDYLVISGTYADDLRRMLAIVEVEKMRTRRAEIPDFPT